MCEQDFQKFLCCGIRDVAYEFIAFLFATTKFPTRNSLKEKGFILLMIRCREDTIGRSL